MIAILIGLFGVLSVRKMAFGHRHSLKDCWENLIKIDGAKDQWALEFGQSAGARPTVEDLAPSDGSGYLRIFPRCFAGEYEIGPVGERPRCDSGLPDHSFEAMERWEEMAERERANEARRARPSTTPAAPGSFAMESSSAP